MGLGGEVYHWVKCALRGLLILTVGTQTNRTYKFLVTEVYYSNYPNRVSLGFTGETVCVTLLLRRSRKLVTSTWSSWNTSLVELKSVLGPLFPSSTPPILFQWQYPFQVFLGGCSPPPVLVLSSEVIKKTSVFLRVSTTPDKGDDRVCPFCSVVTVSSPWQTLIFFFPCSLFGKITDSIEQKKFQYDIDGLFIMNR